MIRVLLGLLLVGAAGLLPRGAPATSSVSKPSAAAIVFAAAGREHAAGSVAWVRVLQLIGDAHYQKDGMPFLEDWLDIVTRLEPRMTNAYYLGTVLLLTDRARSGHMDEILVRGERLYPREFRFPMMRGIGAYFGRFDNVLAAEQFAQASQLPGAPPFLQGLAEKARTQATTCVDLGAQAKSLKANGLDAMGVLETQRIRVYQACIQRSIEQAVAAFRLNEGRVPTLTELLDQGYLSAPPDAPPGRCWIIDGPDAKLETCP